MFTDPLDLFAWRLEQYLLVALSRMTDDQLNAYFESLSPTEFDDLINVIIDHMFDAELEVLARSIP